MQSDSCLRIFHFDNGINDSIYTPIVSSGLLFPYLFVCLFIACFFWSGLCFDIR